MNDHKTWAEALNINPESLSHWSAQAPSGKPVLVYCLEQGYVDYAEYMQWAQENFQLPVLQSTYFQSAMDKDLLEAARNSGNWSAWMFPVDRWDDVTIVACCTPPGEDLGENVRFVLADPRAMNEIWNASENLSPTLESGPVDMPSGLSLDTKAFVLDLDNASLNLGPAPVETPAAETDVSFVLNVPNTTVSTPVSAPKAPPELRVVANETPAAPVIPPTPAVLTKPTPVAPRKPTGTPARHGSARVDENAVVNALFESLTERFEGAVIMKCEDQEAKLYKWDANLTPPEEAEKTSVNLSYPTFMRIVAKTNMPYHGYLVDSPAHQQFFGALGLSTLPKCVTAIPVRFDEQLWGLVVAFGPEDNQKMEYLNFAQEAVERLMNSMITHWAKIA